MTDAPGRPPSDAAMRGDAGRGRRRGPRPGRRSTCRTRARCGSSCARTSCSGIVTDPAGEPDRRRFGSSSTATTPWSETDDGRRLPSSRMSADARRSSSRCRATGSHEADAGDELDLDVTMEPFEARALYAPVGRLRGARDAWTRCSISSTGRRPTRSSSTSRRPMDASTTPPTSRRRPRSVPCARRRSSTWRSSCRCSRSAASTRSRGWWS